MSETARPVRDTASAYPAAVILAQEPERDVTPVLASPVQILAQNQPQARGGIPRKWLWYGAGGLLAMQIVFPHDLKPVTIAGQTVGTFYEGIMGTGTTVAVDRALVEDLARHIANLRARHADAVGQCWLAGIAGAEGISLCRSAVDSRFLPSISQAQAQLDAARRGIRR